MNLLKIIKKPYQTLKSKIDFLKKIYYNIYIKKKYKKRNDQMRYLTKKELNVLKKICSLTQPGLKVFMSQFLRQQLK